MKRALLTMIPIALAMLTADCFGYDTVVDYPESIPAINSAEATEAAGTLPAEEPDAKTPELITQEPQTQAPLTTEAAKTGDDMLILVNFENPIYHEPPVVLICDYLTAKNVYCDPRRHANETAVTALNVMLLAAENEGDFHFIISSAFRYIWEQQMMWEGKLKEDPSYGSAPYNNPVKLMPTNCSEHTTGLAFDILCESCRHSEPSFANTPEGRWLAANAHRFGFILRYPADKQHITGVQYEPWHFRYVGKEAAEYIYEHAICLEEYLNMP